MVENYKIHGHVTIVDDLGNILVDKDNMIVATGRNLILKAVFDETDPAIEVNKFDIYLDNSDVITTDGLTYNDLSSNIINNNNYSIIYYAAKDPNANDQVPAETATSDTIIHIQNEADLYNLIKFDLSVSNNQNGFDIHGLGLKYSIGNDEYKLFSRVTFAPIYITPTRTYTVSYKIYF